MRQTIVLGWFHRISLPGPVQEAFNTLLDLAAGQGKPVNVTVENGLCFASLSWPAGTAVPQIPGQSQFAFVQETSIALAREALEGRELIMREQATLLRRQVGDSPTLLQLLELSLASQVDAFAGTLFVPIFQHLHEAQESITRHDWAHMLAHPLLAQAELQALVDITRTHDLTRVLVETGEALFAALADWNAMAGYLFPQRGAVSARGSDIMREDWRPYAGVPPYGPGGR